MKFLHLSTVTSLFLHEASTKGLYLDRWYMYDANVAHKMKSNRIPGKFSASWSVSHSLVSDSSAWKKRLIESMVPLSKTFFLLFSVYSIAHRNFISGMGKSARYPFDTQKTICMTPKLGKTDIKRLRAVWKWRIVKTTTLNPSIGTPTHFEENSCWKVCAFFNTFSHDIEQVPNKLMQCTVIKLIFAFVVFFAHIKMQKGIHFGFRRFERLTYNLSTAWAMISVSLDLIFIMTSLFKYCLSIPKLYVD